MAKQAPIKHVKLSQEEIARIESRAFERVAPLLEGRFYLLAVCVVKEGAQWLLQIFIEHPTAESAAGKSVSLQDCEAASRLINAGWEAVEADLQKDMPLLKDWSYNLEVSSPGIFRPLKTAREFEFYYGQPIRMERIEATPNVKKEAGAIKKIAGAKKTPATIEIARGTLLRFEEATQTVFFTSEDSNSQTQSLQLDNQTQVILNPVIRLEDEDSAPVAL